MPRAYGTLLGAGDIQRVETRCYHLLRPLCGLENNEVGVFCQVKISLLLYTVHQIISSKIIIDNKHFSFRF